MAGGGIGVDYSLKGLPRMLPGLILCIVFGWSALQWDQTTHRWAGEFKEASAIVKLKQDNKLPADYDAYKTGKNDKYKAALEKFKAGEVNERRLRGHCFDRSGAFQVYVRRQSGAVPIDVRRYSPVVGDAHP
jgi:hypothetical protein